jgi:hypothetical protein
MGTSARNGTPRIGGGMLRRFGSGSAVAISPTAREPGIENRRAGPVQPDTGRSSRTGTCVLAVGG